MTDENKAFLEEYYPFYQKFMKTQELRGMGGYERQSMQRIANQEWNTGWSVDLWCNTCFVDFFKDVFKRYEQWMAEQPITVAANFPKHDKPE